MENIDTYKQRLEDAASALEDVQYDKHCEFHGELDNAISDVLDLIYDEIDKLA